MPDRVGLRVDVENFPSVGGIHRARSDGVVRGRIYVELPEKFRAGESGFAGAQLVPDFFAVNEPVRLLPELNFGQFAVVPAVADNAVRGGRFAGEIRGLRRAGDGGKRG